MSSGDNNAFQPIERASGQPALTVRQARAADRDAVLAFCAQTWAGGDYIQHVWDEWLADAGADTGGVLLVALLGERPVGLLHLRMLGEREGWIEGVRVDPTVRRQGIARVLVMRALADARQRSAQVVRMITDADNLPSQRLFGDFGFTRIAEVVRYEAPALADAPSEPSEPNEPNAVESDEASDAPDLAAEPHTVDGAPLDAEEALGPRLTIAGAEDRDRIWQWLEQSNLAPFTAGLEFDGWAALALSETALGRHLAAGGVWLLEEWQTIQALAITELSAASVSSADEPHPATLQVRYLDGTSDGISRLALVLREVAGEQGAAQVTLWLPDILIVRDAMDGAGFAREDAMCIYARSL